jgi:hypothetical protein
VTDTSTAPAEGSESALTRLEQEALVGRTGVGDFADENAQLLAEEDEAWHDDDDYPVAPTA